MIWQACGRRGSGNQQKGFDVAVFVRMGLRAGLQGVPGGAQGAKGSLWCPAGREKTGKKRENLSRAGHRRRKRAMVPRRQRKNREEERKSEAGGAQEKKKSCGPPPSKKKHGRREKIRGGRGTGSKKKLSYPACHQ